MIASTNSGSDPERFALSPDGKIAYIANENDAVVSFLDLATGKIVNEVKVGPEPEGVGVSPDGSLIVATSETASLAHFIDARTGKLMANVPVGTRPRAVLFLDGGRTVLVSSEQRGTITVFDAPTHKVRKVVDLTKSFEIDEPIQAVEMLVTRKGKRLFVAMGRSNRVAELNPATYELVRWFPTGFRTWGIAISPDERRLYAASGLSGDLTIIDLERNRMVRKVHLGGKPWGAVAVQR